MKIELTGVINEGLETFQDNNISQVAGNEALF